METVSEISLDGFQVVSGDYFTNFTRSSEPTLTIWDGSIGFSKQDIVLLNKCENVRMQINYDEKKILVQPAVSSDREAVRWVKNGTEIEARKISCQKLTDKLYSAWDFDKDYIFRARGKLVTAGNKVMMLFDFTYPEHWKRPELKNVK